jgi:S-adenosylmethionine:tRNA ribosyltransferase-isomerase
MFTNFHLPRTTMLAMISALAGHAAVFSAYESAVKERYRFLSFGDSMLIV